MGSGCSRGGSEIVPAEGPGSQHAQFGNLYNAKTHEELVNVAKNYYCQHMPALGEKKEGEQAEWNYGKHGDDWDVQGTEQSPIDIALTDAKPTVTHTLKLWWNQKPFKTKVVDNGHTIMVSGPISRLCGTDDTRKTNLYEALQMHFHEPSEHTIDGKNYPLELHIVHTIAHEHFKENHKASPQRNLAVCGIFFEIDDNAPPNGLLTHLKLDQLGEEIEVNMDKAFGQFDRPEFFAYRGSLTTPPCSEVVNWFVLKTPLKMTSKQLEFFTKRHPIYGGNGNNRTPQPLNNRKVHYGNCDGQMESSWPTGPVEGPGSQDNQFSDLYHAKTHQDLVNILKNYYCDHMQTLKPKKEEEHHWDYVNHGEDWGVKGNEQSPIDIAVSDAKPTVTHTLKLWWNQKSFTTKVVDNGHTVMVSGPFSKLCGTDDTRKTNLYESVQMHFHDPSEHTIDGKNYPLELHIVHAIGHEHFKENHKAAPQRNIAVCGIFFEVDDEAPPNEFLKHLKLDNIGEEFEFNAHKAFGHFNQPEFFSYRGSLTTPPCSEVVNWFVLKKPLKINSDQLEFFTKRHPLYGGTGNNRKPQPLNGRKVHCGNCDHLIESLHDFTHHHQ